VLAASGDGERELCRHVATTACEWWDVVCHERAQSHAWTAHTSIDARCQPFPLEKVAIVSVGSYTPPLNPRWCCIDPSNAPGLSELVVLRLGLPAIRAMRSYRETAVSENFSSAPSNGICGVASFLPPKIVLKSFSLRCVGLRLRPLLD